MISKSLCYCQAFGGIIQAMHFADIAVRRTRCLLHRAFSSKDDLPPTPPPPQEEKEEGGDDQANTKSYIKDNPGMFTHSLSYQTVLRAPSTRVSRLKMSLFSLGAILCSITAHFSHEDQFTAKCGVVTLFYCAGASTLFYSPERAL